MDWCDRFCGNFWNLKAPVHFSDIPCSSNFYKSLFSSIFVKLDISIISEAIILIVLVNLPMVNIYKFYKKETLVQPPWEPREQHLGGVRPKKFELHKKTKWLEGSIYIGTYFSDDKDLISLASKFQNISLGNFKTSWSSCF